MTPRIKTFVDNIMECMTGEDGGASFVHFRTIVEDMESRAASGDDSAKKVLDVVERFSRLIDVANGRLS